MVRCIAALVVLALVGAACGKSSSKAATSGKPVRLSMWVVWTDSDLDNFKKVVATFESLHPDIKVDITPNMSDQTKLVAAVRAGNPPDVTANYDQGDLGKFCTDGALTDLGARESKDHVKATDFPAPSREVFAWRGHHCAVPYMADAMGLYYNKDLLTKAGYSGPPKTVSELADMAKKLTQRNADGSIKVAGFVPLVDFGENYIVNLSPPFGAKYFDASEKADLSRDPAWKSLYTWQKGLVDALGYDALTKFKASLGQEFSADNPFEKGQIAMTLDGEWRTRAIATEHPELNYATAPFPAPDGHPELYGAGSVTPSLIAIPKGAKHPDQAWELIHYLTENTDAVVRMANGLHNVPTTVAALKSPKLSLGPNFGTFLDEFANPKSSAVPILPEGTPYFDPITNFSEKWQSGQIADLDAGLKALDQEIDAVMAKAR